ncbi:MmcQ/YjbR family DNA-binding protein [Phenylobacterium aquaticum]|uniref:MmcQ/YjbR family DNA-binding protein n=1 Tax=Phenylobacterium aquaticum TaxID=1763816 RepID=UPI001F5C5F6C|nr:MmcQ/YjbR family DNA-binding protein [Phenylobacterium aquaticum]MCI3135298.1 MmcQ/YjbR family DNA-binding protein [Phenylobacterium aquaticum]
MPTPTDLHRLALSLPEAVEGDDHGKPAYLVGKKIFCTVGEGGRATLRLDPEDQHNLAAPGAVEPVPGFWGRKGWTFVWLDRVSEDQLALLLRLAWTGVAPKRLRG